LSPKINVGFEVLMNINLEEHTVQITPTAHRWRSLMFFFRNRSENNAINEMV
jgi:hypothetical protein